MIVDCYACGAFGGLPQSLNDVVNFYFVVQIPKRKSFRVRVVQVHEGIC